MYNEKEKRKIRREVIKSSIEILTTRRKSSTISSPQYIKDVQKFLLKDKYDGKYAKLLTKKTFKSWNKYYKSLLMKKKVENLKVAFLSGPNPENDFNELIKNGILEENIWAFESDNNTYSNAIENIINKYPRAKIHRGKIDNFFVTTPIKFDIIYLDFCGPILNRDKKNRNLPTIINLFKSHSLNSPGVLITNFALPSSGQDKTGRALLSKLATLYLYPKAWINGKVCLSEEGTEIQEWYDRVSNEFDDIYGEFISRLIMDISTIIVPFEKLYKNEAYFKTFFNLSEDDKKRCIKNIIFYDELECEQYEENYRTMQNECLKDIDDILLNDMQSIEYEYNVHKINKRGNIYQDCGGWLVQSTSEFSIPWSLTALDLSNEFLSELLNFEGSNYKSDLIDKEFDKFSKMFLNQVSEGDLKALDNIKIIYYMLFANADQQYSDKLKAVYDTKWWKNAPQFCDVFTFHSIIGVLLGQLLVPYHINVKETKRWTYKAKSMKMYTDMFVVDECRYIYDMMPTIDMITNCIENIDYQMCYRFALDALNKNQFLYNNELFPGNAIIGINHEGFEARRLKNRIEIK